MILNSHLSSQRVEDSSFRDNDKWKIIDIGGIGKNSFTSIDNVLLVKGLKHNLLSICQLCDKGCNIVFESSKCEVIDINNKTILTKYRQGNIYMFDINDLCFCKIECLAAMNSDESWLWHRILGHISMRILEKDDKLNLEKIRFVMFVKWANKLKFPSNP